MTKREIAELARELLQAGGNYSIIPQHFQRQVAEHPEVIFVTDLLRSAPREAWDRMIETISPGQASFVLNQVFSPNTKVPSALVNIYDVLENERGVIVTYNYDRITDGARNRFRVITPHGERSHLVSDSRSRDVVTRMMLDLHMPLRNDWWLPIPETVEVQYRAAYQEALTAWRHASTIVFVGYGFGGGADAFSYDDFGRNAAPNARIHVMCPRPDNTDLCKQVGYALKGRGAGFRIFEQPYRWRSLAEAILEYLESVHGSHIWQAVGSELEIAFRHDRR
jgi:hypothetical protein